MLDTFTSINIDRAFDYFLNKIDRISEPNEHFDNFVNRCIHLDKIEYVLFIYTAQSNY
jgi:hypothetical protein